MKVAFVGAGNMGAQIAASPADAVRGVDVAVTMLANDRAVRDAMLDAQTPAIDALARGAVHMCTSTISVALSKDHGCADADWSAVAEVAAKNSGL